MFSRMVGFKLAYSLYAIPSTQQHFEGSTEGKQRAHVVSIQKLGSHMSVGTQPIQVFYNIFKPNPE